MTALQQANDEIERLKAALAAKKPPAKLTLKVSVKGAISIYGLGRWPVTLYREPMLRLIQLGPEILAFIDANSDQLSTKQD